MLQHFRRHIRLMLSISKLGSMGGRIRTIYEKMSLEYFKT